MIADVVGATRSVVHRPEAMPRPPRMIPTPLVCGSRMRDPYMDACKLVDTSLAHFSSCSVLK